MEEKYRLTIDEGTEDAFVKEYTREELESKKDYIRDTYAGRYKVDRVGDADLNNIDDAGNYTLRIGDFSKSYTGSELKGKMDYINQTYGGQYTIESSYGSYNDMDSLFNDIPSARERLEAFNAEHGAFMDDFEARDTAETKMARAGMSSGLVVPAEGSITGEERQRYNDLYKQEEALKKAWYNSPEYLESQGQTAVHLAQMRNEIDRGRLTFAQNNPVIEGYNPSATRGAEADVELQLFETASRIIDDTIKLHNAPSRYDGANAWQNVKKFAKGTGATLSDVDFWTSGLTEIADNLGVRNVLQKVQKELGNLNNLDEATIEGILSPAEKAVLQAWALNAQEQLNRSGDLSRAYQAGQGATESLGFMAEFALTGGVGKAASEGVETMAKWLGRKVLGQMDDAAAATVREMGEKIAKSTVGKYGARLADALAETAGKTLVMPSTFRNISEKAAEIQEDAEGNRYLTRMNDAFAKGFTDSFIENLSEGGRVNAIGDLIGDVAGKIPAYKKIVDKFANSKAGELLTAFNSSGIMNTLRAGGWHGFGEEYLEEWYGNALRTITGLDKDALKDFATVDNQLITITSFLPMTIFGGTVSTAQVLSAKKGLDKKAEMLRSALLERGYDEKQADNMIDMMRGASPAEISQTLTPIVNAVALRDLNEAAALMKPVGEFAEAVRRWQSFDTKYQYQEQEQRDNLRTQMTDTLGQFWQEDENGRQTVQRGVNANGEVVYLLGKPTAEEAQSGMPQQVAAITSEGRKVFVDPSAVRLEEELEMNDFLGTEIMAEKGNKEQVRMIEEKERTLAQVRQMSAPGTTVNLGTTEAPIVGTVAQRTPDGVVITMEDGSARQVSYEELGNYVGVNTTPLTDAQMDERDADALSADRAQREAELDMEYENLGSSENELIEAEAEVEQAVEAATPLPTKADGSVDQTALWNEDPARWAQWNDEQRQDGGMNSLAYINGAIANESAKIAEMQAGYDAITDFDERDALEQEVAAVRERLQTLVDLRDKYSVQAEVAAQAQQANAVAQMTEEEKAEAEEQRREPLRKKAQEWSSRLGVKVNIAESLSDVKEEQAREQILRIDVSGSKERATGWFNPTTGEVTIYLPHTTDSSEIEKTIVHEVVAHKGLRGLLGQEGFNVLCDSVWEMMSAEERQKYLAYPGVNGNKRAAADEYIAHYAETMNLEESKPVWDRIMDLIMRILNSMGIQLEISKEQLSDIIVASYQKLVKEANRQTEAASAEVSSDKGVSFRLSNEVDENGRQFVLTPSGELAFGEITSESGLTPAPILLSEGLITNPVTNDGYGLVHIEARHGDQIRNAGYNSVVEFVEEVAKNYEVIREGKNRDGIQTYMLQLTDKHNNTLMVELSGDGTYWNINTAGIFKTSYGANRKEIYNRHTTDKQSAETAEASQATELSGTQLTSSMNAPTSSEGKVTNNIETDNIEEEINPAFVEAISTDVDEAEYAQFLDGKAFADPQPVDGIQSDDVRFSIVKEDEIRGNTQAYFDKHYKGGKLGKKDQKLVPLNITHFTQELLDAANAQIEEMRKYMLPFLDMESKGKRFLPAEVYGKSTLFDNSSYGKTMENTLICTRTLAYIDFVEEVKKRIGRPLTATESFLASQMLYDIAIDPQRLYCYVSLDRKAYDEFLLRYTQQRDEVISKWNASDKSTEAKEQLYKEFLDGRKPTSQKQARFESWLLLAEGDNAITTADLATKARRGELKISEVPEAWEKARSKYKKLKGEKKLAYAASEEYQTALWNYLASPLGQVTDAEAYAQSASWAKKEEDYRSYTGELLNCTADALKGLMGHYGLRFYSFSEYSPAFILENMQMVRDAAARGLKGFAYTKEADFIRIFAPTGMNINCSVYGRLDSEGNVVPDTKQGADWAQVQALREQYPNVGAVFVATNDAMVEWALNQPWIDVIIPFHIVRTGADIAKFYEWTNYTSMSADTTPSGKSTYVYPHEHHNDKETFLKIAQERGLSPRFADVKLSDGRSIVEHENYMRLVNETRRSVDETPILTPTFNVDAAKESFDAFVEKGGYYSGYFYEDEAFEQGIETVVEDIKAGKTAKDVEYGRQDVPIDVAKIMAKRAEQERKHGKGPVDILEEAKNAAINDVMFRFVGEQAAARLDSAVNATMFMDKLQTAREMEDAGADARVIKRSTGWERGADGKWRHEMPDFEIKAKPGKKKTFKLQDLITDSTLFIEYPQMKDVKVRYKKMASGLMGQLTEENGKPLVEMNDIQFQALNPRYVEAIEAFSQKYPELAEKIGKGGGRGITAEEKKIFIEEVGEILLMQGPYLDLIGGRNTLAHELQHLIQQIEGFAEGGNSDMVDTTDPAIAKENEELKNLIRAEMLAADSMVPELNDLVSQIRAQRAQGIINKRLEDEYNQKRAEWLVHKDNYNRLRKERAKLRRIGNEGYNRLAGEVEARNVEERIKLTDEQRRESLYSDTQDVATEDQIFLRGNLMTTAPLQKSEVSFRITPEMDKAYMDAVKAGDMETAQRMVDEAAEAAGYTIRGDHGRVSKFTIFDRDKANPEGNWGQGFYFTNNEEDVEENYATVDGPDLEAKIEREVEKRVGIAEMNEEFNEDGEVDEFAIREEVEKEFITSEPNIVHAAIKMDKPFVVGHGMVVSDEAGNTSYDMQETYLDVEYEYDEDGEIDYYSEPTGTLIDLINALNEEISNYDWANFNANEILQDAYEGMTASQFESAARELLNSHIDELVNDRGDVMTSEILRAAIERAGFDGIIDNTVNQKFGTQRRYGQSMAGMDSDTRHYISFDSSNIKDTDPVTYDNDGNVIPLSERFNPENEDIRFRMSNENQAIFVSNAARAVEGIKQEKATPEQWLKMLEKAGGLKAGEDKWMGLSDWLKASDKKTLTKAEVLDFINENMIVIEEAHYTTDAEDDAASRHDLLEQTVNERYKEILKSLQDIEDYDERRFKAFDLFQEELGEFADLVELDWSGAYLAFPYEDLADYGEFADMFGVDIKLDNPIHDTRLAYTTPGLDNHHEIALTVPTIEPWNKHDNLHFGDAGDGRAIAWIRFGETEVTEEGSLMDYEPKNDVERDIKNYIEYAMRNGDDFNTSVGYAYNQITDAPQESVGWTEEAVTAVADGMRGTARVRKVLVIDEIQSNRHQKGREKGYKKNSNSPAAREIKRYFRSARDAYNAYQDQMAEKYGNDFKNASSEADFREILTSEEFTYLLNLRNEWEAASLAYGPYKGGIPDAPFDKNWHELAMKRMLRYAAENGYDAIAWTKGDQQANRYGLSRDVKRITASRPSKDGERIVNIYYRDEYNDYKNFVVDKEGKVVQGDYTGNALADVVGKEMALQIMNAEDATEFKGDGLKVGGEGMRGFYDKMLPAFMNKYGKKWGIKVEDIDLPNLGKSGYTMHSVPVTEEMKASVMEGQVMFRTTEITPEVRDEMDVISATALINGTYMQAPNGKPTNLTAEQWAMVRTKNFKKWFGDWENDPENASKVVDENGEPKVVYHGGAWRPLLEERGNAVFKLRGGLMGKGAYFTDKLSTAIEYARDKYGWEHDEEVSDEFLDDNGYVTEVFLNIRNEDNIREYYGETYYLATNHGQIKSAIANTGEFSLNFDIRFRVNENPTEAQKEAGNYKMGHLNLDGYRITIENPKGSVRRGTDSKGNAWENTLNNDYGYIRGTEGVDGDHIDVYLSDNPSEGNVFVVDQVNPQTREFDEHKVMYGFNSAEEAREAYLANFSEGWGGLGTITEVTKDEFKKWIQSSHRKTKPFSEYKSVKAIGAQSEGEEMEDYLLPSSGTPTDEVVANGLDLTPAQTAELAGNIFAALPEESRKKITEGLSNVFDLKDAILQIPTSLAMKEKWNDEDRQMADIVASEVTKMAGEMTRPFSASEGLWVLYNALNPISEYDIVSQASRALVQRNLGFDAATLEVENEAKEDVRFRTVGNASANAKASLYNRGAANVWTRLKESFVDMNASVEELVNAIEKASGKKAEGFENVLLALNQQSSKGLAAMETYEQKFLNKMLNEIRAIMNKTDFKYEDIVRYVILKHGLERNEKMAQRDAKAHYQKIYDDIIAKIKGMNPAQKRTYLTNAQLKDSDAKAELTRLQGVNTSALTPDQLRDHKKELAKAKKEASEAAEHLVRAQKIATMTEQDAQNELDKIFKKIEKGTDSVYKEMRKNDYSGISSMFYDTLGVDRKNYATEEEYQSALMQAKADKYDNLSDIEGAAQTEVTLFENAVDTKDLWKSINNATKETLRQQYEANMISKDQYLNLRDMFEFYVPLRGFADNTAEDMYTYYRRPNSTGYTKPILGAEGRKTEAESPFGWIAAMAGSAIASNVKNEAKLALYYFVANRPENGIATLSRTWFVHTPGDVDANGKKIFRPAYPPFNEDLSTDAAKQAYEDWQEQMKDLQKQGLAYESGQKLNLGDTVVNISDKNKPEHIVNVKIGGKDYTIIINGNPRAAQAINGDLNIEATSQDYGAIFGPVLRWMSSVNTSYNPEFWITNMMRDMAFTWMAVNIKGEPAYRRRFSDNYAKAFRVIRMAAKNEKDTLGNSYLEQMYQEFVKYGGVTGYTQIKDSETWEKEIAGYLASNDPAIIKKGKLMRGIKDLAHGMHRFGESLEQVSRFAAFLTAREMGKSINEAIDDAKEITVNFNRKGSGKMITLAEARHLTGRNGRPLSEPAQWAAVAFSSISPLGRRFIMFFNAAIQGLNATYKLWKKNPSRFVGWTLAYAAFGAMNAVAHALADDDDDYLDIPQYERRTNLMLGFNGTYIKWALPQEARAFYALGDLAVESIMGRNPHQNVLGEAAKIATEVLPVNPTEGWKAFMPSAAVPLVEIITNKDYKGDPIYNEQKWLSEEERRRSAKWSSAYQGTGKLYVWIAQGLNYATGGDKRDAGFINLQPEKMEHLVQSAFGGTIRTADKFISTVVSLIDPEEPWTAKQTPFLNRFLTINDERYRNVHVNDVFDYYEAEAEHAATLEKKYKKDGNSEALKNLRMSDEYKLIKIYSKYKKSLEKIQEKIKVADGTAERKDLMKQQDELKRRMIKEISELP